MNQSAYRFLLVTESPSARGESFPQTVYIHMVREYPMNQWTKAKARRHFRESGKIHYGHAFADMKIRIEEVHPSTWRAESKNWGT